MSISISLEGQRVVDGFGSIYEFGKTAKVGNKMAVEIKDFFFASDKPRPEFMGFGIFHFTPTHFSGLKKIGEKEFLCRMNHMLVGLAQKLASQNIKNIEFPFLLTAQRIILFEYMWEQTKNPCFKWSDMYSKQPQQPQPASVTNLF